MQAFLVFYNFRWGISGLQIVGCSILFIACFAGVAELADARDSKSRSVRSVGSTPTAGRFFVLV